MLLLRLFTLLALLAVSFFPAFAQDILLTGRVQAQATKAAIPFVNIGIRGKNVGTIADENGGFSLRIPAQLAHDTLTFSAVGFQEQSRAIAGAQQHTVVLAEKATALKEIVVLGRTPKTRRIGTTTHSPVIWGQVRDRETHDIREFAKLISLGSRPAELVQAHIFLRYPTVDTLAFRLNFYRVAEGLPGERLIEQAILVRTPIENGWLTIDLTKYDLRLQTDFFVGFEFLPGKEPAVPVTQSKFAQPIFSYGGQFGGAAISRSSSLGAWKREPGASLSAYLTVRQ
ncbi:carboxypeptidase-like regulatory domain-containing protein [Hymenobacter sp. DH14]|uniref:Carboxypeptidase-like regulatory domain-containing protein n=1 Tax=Hymenobacter cyanobacteriorum TaxID=2926463 RepID=A0A9X1VHV3_9BACT|nr:carboxypeptidase-like regulatory domain-containing protein [Hymenobacter cyanobacteriorum]MCI1189072.1 carboxypeptidase-like regulatory domain-containing protein [Hymenobacter cyanobacteriorum]